MEMGHVDARHYPLGWLADEWQIAFARRRGIILLENNLLLSALGAANNGKNGFAAWKKAFQEYSIEAVSRREGSAGDS